MTTSCCDDRPQAQRQQFRLGLSGRRCWLRCRCGYKCGCGCGCAYRDAARVWGTRRQYFWQPKHKCSSLNGKKRKPWGKRQMIGKLLNSKQLFITVYRKVAAVCEETLKDIGGMCLLYRTYKKLRKYMLRHCLTRLWTKELIVWIFNQVLYTSVMFAKI